MKKIIITLLLVVFQLSCKGQDFKQNIIGKWEQELSNENGIEYYEGEIWTFYTDGTCQIDYGSEANHSISKFTYTITNDDCSGNPKINNTRYYLKMNVTFGEDEDICFLISEINNSVNSDGKIKMLLYAYGANGNNVFVKRP
jgi:hypothetical protein